MTDTLLNALDGDDISTHTLTWSVTQTLKADHALMDISTHTLTWSVTHYKKIT